MDQRLFQSYLAAEGPEAGRWNRSPHCLYAQYWTRDFLAKQIEPFPGIEVCNVGIGEGSWDNYLCDWVGETGRLTSVDIGRDMCDMFTYRQQREGHSNPSTVVCADIMEDTLPAASFDVVTAIGSTVNESSDYERCLTSCWRLVRPGGHMMFMEYARYSSPEQFEPLAAALGTEIVTRRVDETVKAHAFWVKKRGVRP